MMVMMNYFVVRLTDERRLDLFLAGNIVRDPHQSSGFIAYLNIFLEVFVNHQSQKSRKFCIDIKYVQIIQYN